MEVGDGPEIIVPERDNFFLGGDPKGGPGANGLKQVGKTRRIGVPVASPVVVEPADGHDGGKAGRREGEQRNEPRKHHESVAPPSRHPAIPPSRHISITSRYAS